MLGAGDMMYNEKKQVHTRPRTYSKLYTASKGSLEKNHDLTKPEIPRCSCQLLIEMSQKMCCQQGRHCSFDDWTPSTGKGLNVNIECARFRPGKQRWPDQSQRVCTGNTL
ncbi:hypothetical protein CEXT_142441 [Caerostris extrusa]|uniref:Uncharacterized protein n=1 Tax=Caerostris extrusa TaxID=172846 RepID=A0AAV4ULC5_CAEEX|nr:hypothetical protein CEXT_142441 [Caerostris extrusa]